MLSTASASRLSKGRCCLSSDCSCEVMEDNVDVITRIVNGGAEDAKVAEDAAPYRPLGPPRLSRPRVLRVLRAFAMAPARPAPPSDSPWAARRPGGGARNNPSAAAPCRARCQSRSEEHTSELQSRLHLVCRLLLEKKKNTQ